VAETARDISVAEAEADLQVSINGTLICCLKFEGGLRALNTGYFKLLSWSLAKL